MKSEDKMASISTPFGSARFRRSWTHHLKIYLKEARYEFVGHLRLPVYSLSIILFPVMFYILFGLVLGRQFIGRVNMATYLIATYGTFGVMGASLFGVGAGLATARGQGWLLVKRASPMPPMAFFVGKIVTAVLFSLIIVLLLMSLGVAFGQVHLSTATAARLVATVVSGAVPFCALGLVIGYFAGPNSAAAVVNLIYLPLSFCSGLWIPVNVLPSFFQHLAKVLPPYHAAQLALRVIGADRGEPPASHWEFLAAFTLLCLGLARIGFQRDEGKLYG
jgi:ABC-2 type transport system permease protein